MEKYPQNRRNGRFNKKNAPKNKAIDFGNIAKYFVYYIVFALLCYGVQSIVLMALSHSPTKTSGNGFVQLMEVHNTGAAFNLFSGHPDGLITMAFMAVLIITFVVLVFSARLSHSAIVAMGFLSCGITMNMIDRLQHGYVIDYVQLEMFPNLPVFNIPDLMIVFGTFSLIIAVLFSRK